MMSRLIIVQPNTLHKTQRHAYESNSHNDKRRVRNQVSNLTKQLLSSLERRIKIITKNTGPLEKMKI